MSGRRVEVAHRRDDLLVHTAIETTRILVGSNQGAVCIVAKTPNREALFGLPPEQPAPRALLSPLRAFVILASAGLAAWLLAVGGSTDSPGDAPADPARAPSVSGVSRSSVERVESPPTAEEALALFTSLDRLRATATETGAGRVLTAGLSLRRLERTVPPGGQARHVEVLSLETDRIRIRQEIELSSWASTSRPETFRLAAPLAGSGSSGL
jgi:hypothetical protein